MIGATFHKCSSPVLRTKSGGLTDRNAICGKLATVKSKIRKGYVCSEHALEEERKGARHATVPVS